MGSAELAVGRTFLLRAKYDSDLVEFITEQVKKHKIALAAFTVIGALKSAKLGFYDQKMHTYYEYPLDYPQEIASCIGNVSIKEGEPFVHAHAVLSDQNGNTKAGHLIGGKVFAAEIYISELLCQRVERKKDAETGLSLWDI